MMKDTTEFRQRFQRWKNGEQVYDKGRVIPHYRTGLDGGDDTVPSDNTRVVNPRLLTAEKIVDLPTAADLLKAKHEAEQIGPTPNISQQERDLGRKKYETQQWVQQKKALEQATDEIMMGILDPRYAALGFGLGQVARAAGSVINAGKNLYKGYKVSKAIDKAVDGGFVNRPIISYMEDSPYKYKGAVGFLDNQNNDAFKQYLLSNTLSHSKEELQAMEKYQYLGNIDDIVDKKLTDQETIDVFNNSVLPRLQFMRPSYRGGLMYPTVKSNVAHVLNTPYTVYPDWLYKEYKGGNFVGSYFPNNHHISVAKSHENFAKGHEYRHMLDDMLRLTEDEDFFLYDAYGDDFVKDAPELVERLKGVNMYPERVTTNFDARNKLLGPHHSTKTDWQLQNKIIDMKSDEDIFKSVEEANGYGKEYIKLLRNRGQLTPEKAALFRKAMKFVGGVSVPTVLSIPSFINDKR